MRLIWAILGLIVLLIGIGFSLLNTQTAELYYYLGHIKAPVCLIVILSFIIGALVGLAIGFTRGRLRARRH